MTVDAVDITSSFAATFVDELVRNGLTDAVVAPGSRSAPLAIALARDPRVAVHVVVDERSAAFRALGLGLAAGRPALVCCTSGTAAANFHPAVVEAHHAGVPMIVATADRPPELHDVGAPQTIDQTHLFGGAVRWFHDPGPPELTDDAETRWRALACRAVAETAAGRPGPVHLNLPFREPLVPSGGALLDARGRPNGSPWVAPSIDANPIDDATAARITALVHAHPDGVIVAGWGTRADARTLERCASATGWPVLADAISGVRTGARVISTYERLLRDAVFAESHRPSVVLQLGAPLTSKVANTWLEQGPPPIVCTPYAEWLDPDRRVTERIVGDEDVLLTAVTRAIVEARDSKWLDSWLAAEHAGREAIDAALDQLDEPIEGLLARDLAAALPDGANLVVASSIPVRALEWCMAPRSGLRMFANRGANGIDGFVSTARGIAAAGDGPTVALCGDLAFLHDTNGLLGAAGTPPVTFVVIDNDGGGIFGFLPPAELPEFETLFATPHGLDIVAVARAHGVRAERVKRIDEIEFDASETNVVVIPVDRTRSVELHRNVLGN